MAVPINWVGGLIHDEMTENGSIGYVRGDVHASETIDPRFPPVHVKAVGIGVQTRAAGESEQNPVVAAPGSIQLCEERWAIHWGNYSGEPRVQFGCRNN